MHGYLEDPSGISSFEDQVAQDNDNVQEGHVSGLTVSSRSGAGTEEEPVVLSDG